MQAAEELIVLKGHGFSPAINSTKQWWALVQSC